MYSYLPVGGEFYRGWRWRYSYMFLEEASPCFLDNVYEVLVIICWHPQGVVHPNSAFIDLDNKKDPVKLVSCTYMHKKCWIYIQWSQEKKIKNSLEVVLKQNVLLSILLMQGPEDVVLGPIRPFPDTPHVYYMVLWSRRDISLFSGILEPSSYTIKNEGRGWENT